MDDQVSDLAIGLIDDRMVEKESEVRIAGHVAELELHQSYILLLSYITCVEPKYNRLIRLIYAMVRTETGPREHGYLP